MCLIVDKRNALVAEEDIICYKVYMYCEPKDEYKSPFQLCRIKKFNKVIHVPKFLDPIEKKIRYILDFTHFVMRKVQNILQNYFLIKYLNVLYPRVLNIIKV